MAIPKMAPKLAELRTTTSYKGELVFRGWFLERDAVNHDMYR